MWVSSSSSNLSISGSTPTTSSFYNTANNHFTAVNYDNAGNQTSKLYPTTSTFAYDAESRQNSTYSNTNGTSTYAYDGAGHRVTKVALGATITYVYDALGRMAAEYSTAEGVPDCTTCYIVDDHLGNTRLVLDESANVVSRHDYQPYGQEVPDVNGRTSLWGATDAINQKFTGKERDLETNFDYFGARYYGYLQGRFTSPDWAAKAEAIPYAELSNPQSLNLYGYVLNNPPSRADTDGHCDKSSSLCGAWTWLTSSHSEEKSASVSAVHNSATIGPVTTDVKFGTAQVNGAASYGTNTSASGGASASLLAISAKEGKNSTTQININTANVGASGGISLGGEKGLAASTSAGANTDFLSVKQTETFSAGPVTVTASATGNVGIGANVSASIGTTGFSASGGFTFGYGGALSLAVGWSGAEANGGASVKGDSSKQTTKINGPEVK